MISPIGFFVWRQTPQYTKVRRVGCTDCRDFIGIYGHIAYGWNVLIGVVRPRFNWRLLLP